MEYTKLEYIESTGTQYIDLGFKLSSNYAVDMDLQLITTNANIFGSRSGAMDRAFTLFANGSSILTDMGNTRSSTTATTDKINVYLSSNKIKIGTFEKNISSGSFTTPGNGYIFNISYSRPQSYMASMKLYSCKVYLSGTLVRDLIPCKYNNQIGLWDAINGSFLGNLGTGEFVAGPEQGKVIVKYIELKFIEGTGTQWIDTKIIPVNANYKAEICYQSTKIATSSSESFIFGYWLESGQSGGWRAGIAKNTLTNTGVGFTFDNTVATKKTIATSSGATAYNSSQSPYLFSQNYKNTANTVADGQYRLYYCKMWNGNTLVRDFIPCKYYNNIGLWDKVSETFFANSGTGEFIAGSEVGPKTLKVKMVEKNDLYTKLEYLQSTGTQYIDTGVKFGADFACDIKFNMLSTSGDIDILSSAQNDNYLLVSYLNGTPRIYLNSSSASRNITMPYNTIHTVNMNYNGSTLTYIVDNTTTYTVSKSNATANSNLLLFARSSSYGFSKAILYYCKIWNGGTLVKDLIPVKRALDNTICLYDLVSNTFLENSGTGEFVEGSYSLIGKTVSKINSKYPKTLNGISIQCWKKKEIDINFADVAQLYEDDLSILKGTPLSNVIIENIDIDDYNNYSKNIQSGVYAANVNEEYIISPTELYEKMVNSVPSQITTNYGNEIDLSKFDINIPFVKCVGTVSGASKVQFSISSEMLKESASEDYLIMSVNTINDSIVICELDDYDAEMGNIQVTFNQWDNMIFLILQRIEDIT